MAVTFEVSKVEGPTRAPREIRLEQAMRSQLESRFEACAANLGHLVKTDANPFVGAAHLAFAEHYPLTLSPDDVWLCIAQGFAAHVDLHAENLRHHFVQHEGQAEITVIRDNFVKGSPTNDWQGVFGEFSNQIAKFVGKKRDLVVADFSTTGAVEKAASEVVLMSAMKHYFKYVVLTRCGIPSITLLGTPDDWRSVRVRAGVLAEFGLEHWTRWLLPALDQFVAAAEGNADRAMWSSFYKYESRSGGDTVSGWINALFPYLRERGNTKLVPNPDIAGRGFHGPTLASFASGMSIAPFTWQYLGTPYPMDFAAGFVAVSYQGGGVRPAIGWAVRGRPRDLAR